jgi:type I restriction-modification system DNA methylase subunit
MTTKELKIKLQQQYTLQNAQDVLKEVLGTPVFLSNERYEPLFQEIDFVEKAFQFGAFDVGGNKKIGFIDVQLKSDGIRIVNTRVKLRELAAKLVGLSTKDGDSFMGILAFFHSPSQPNYRLSLIAKSNIYDAEKDNFTEFQTANKRFSFVLGKGESCTTAAIRLATLREQHLNDKSQDINLQDVIEAFNVDKLNKDFFKGYKERYENLWQYINNQTEYRNVLIDSEQTEISKTEKPIRDFAKKLLGRIVFLYFLQKKGWLGVSALQTDWKDGDAEFIKHLFQNATDKSRFYSDYLVELFFNTLNKDRKNENDIFKPTNSKVPYLNGGLFDNDAPKTNHFNFPESYFTDLFDFFEQYNFTIDENSPDDAEVGIDPEMLGHIFENLLEENKDKGAFYTPKEVVQFMCQEALVQYLKPHFAEEASIEGFIRKKDISDFLKKKEEAQKLDKLLSKVRICDPAIGSGAFPIGILQEIFEAKRFIFPYLHINNFDAAEVKLRIIEHSIYGIDLDKGAVDIARLRFWLALVVDEDTPRPLPNLDYKIMQGNSLFDTFEGINLSKIGMEKDDNDVITEKKPQLNMFGEPEQILIGFDVPIGEEFSKLIHDYFNPKEGKLTKSDIRKKIEEKINKKILTESRTQKLALQLSISKQEKTWKEQKVFDRLNPKSKEYKTYTTMLELYESYDQRGQRLLELQEKPNEKPYFLWRLFFKEVFMEGGFDIVIGNPPYFSISKQPQLKELSKHYKTFEPTGDIYSLFYERGHQILRSGGVLVYITGSSWLRSNYGKSLRKFFREETNPLKLIDLSDCQIFESATVLTTIMAYRKQANANTLAALRLTRRTQYAVKQLNNYFDTNHIQLQSQPDEAWVILDRTRYDLKQKIEAQGTKLKEWNVKINRGIITGLNEAFIIDKPTRDILISKNENSQELIGKILRGKDIEKFRFNWEEKYILLVKYGMNNQISEYSAIYEWLLQFEEGLRNRGQCNTTRAGSNFGNAPVGERGQHHWIELDNNPSQEYLDSFLNEKIIYPEITKFLNFTYDSKGFYTNNKCYILTGSHLKYLVGVFNSKLFRFAFEENFPELQGNSRELRKVIFDEIPIKIPSEQEEKNISIVADYLLYLYEATHERVNPYADNKQVAGFFEDIMNHLVCELYFEEEMIENGIGMRPVLELTAIDQLNEATQGETIGDVFKRLQTPGSPVRKCIAMANIKLPDTIGKILSNTI